MVAKKYKFSHISLSTSSKDKRVIPIATQVYEILSNADIKVSFDESLVNLEKNLKVKTKSENYKKRQNRINFTFNPIIRYNFSREI